MIRSSRVYLDSKLSSCSTSDVPDPKAFVQIGGMLETVSTGALTGAIHMLSDKVSHAYLRLDQHGSFMS